MKETIVKINKTKIWFSERMNKIDKPLVTLIMKKWEKNQINKIRNEKREVTTDNVEIQRILRDYNELYGNKMDNLEEMDRFLEKFSLPRLNQEVWTTQLQALKLKLWSKISPKAKAQDQMASQENCIKYSEKSNAYPSKTLSKNHRGGNTFKLILQGHHHPDTKTRQRQHEKRKLQANITDEFTCKNPQQNSSKQNLATRQKAHAPWSSWVHANNARILTPY